MLRDISHKVFPSLFITKHFNQLSEPDNCEILGQLIQILKH